MATIPLNEFNSELHTIGNINGKNGLNAPKDGEFKLIGRMKLKADSSFHSDDNNKYYRGVTVNTGANIIVRQIQPYKQEQSKINNDVNLSSFFENENISSILKIRDYEAEGDTLYVQYESFESTLEKFWIDELKLMSKEKFMDITKSILDAVETVHSKQIALNNISSSNMAYCLDNKTPKIKIFNLSVAERLSELHKEDCYAIDIKNVGIILLSAVTQGENLEKNKQGIEKISKFDDKKEFIYNKLKAVQYIEPYKKESFAHLVASLLEVTDKKIHNFLDHPFFWSESKINLVIKTTNSWIDKNSKVADKEMMKKFNEVVNYDKNNPWRSLIVEEEVKNSITGNFGDTGGELLRFIRNKIVHSTDYREELGPFFQLNGGPFKYFFEKFERLFFILSTFYLENNLCETHKADEKSADSEKNPQIEPTTSTKEDHPPPSQHIVRNKNEMNIKTSYKVRNSELVYEEESKNREKGKKNVTCWRNNNSKRSESYQPPKSNNT